MCLLVLCKLEKSQVEKSVMIVRVRCPPPVLSVKFTTRGVRKSAEWPGIPGSYMGGQARSLPVPILAVEKHFFFFF